MVNRVVIKILRAKTLNGLIYTSFPIAEKLQQKKNNYILFPSKSIACQAKGGQEKISSKKIRITRS